jgi:mRNA interferase HigB
VLAPMRIIAKRRLMDLATRYGDCLAQVTVWFNIASKANWRTLEDVRLSFRHADSVDDKTVFNIKGNDYRLIVVILNDKGIIYIRYFLKHAEYDRSTWK